MTNAPLIHVAVLMGGWSSERSVSLSSGNGIADALERVGYAQGWFTSAERSKQGTPKSDFL